MEMLKVLMNHRDLDEVNEMMVHYFNNIPYESLRVIENFVVLDDDY